MSNLKKLCLLVAVPALLSGCQSSITNLTPTQYPRSANGYYRVEAMWRSNRSAVRTDSFKPLVVVDMTAYPMHKVPVVQDRWEAFIPVPANEDTVHYHYKFDFLDNGWNKPKADSLMSGSYTLNVK